MGETHKMTVSEAEEVVNEFAQQYAKEWNLPPHAVRVILWPGDYNWKVKRGPTAMVKLGRAVDDKRFMPALKEAVMHVAKSKAWESMELVSMIDVAKHESNMRRFKTMHERIPRTLSDAEMRVSRITRVEAIHLETGLREVVEVESGRGAIFAMTEVAKYRLARRVHEHRMKEAEQVAKQAEVQPVEDVA